MNDATLLKRFVSGGEEAAFTALMQRHVPQVRAACRSILRSEHDAEDVVQSTFLTLALKADQVHWRDSVGGWLCAVARRLSLDARAGLCRRSRRETPLAAFEMGHDGFGASLPEPFDEVDRLDLRRMLDDELNRLPEKYRVPVLLCDLEGLTHAEAARRLGLPTGSMSRRLSRARTLLRHRLTARGLSMAVMVLCAVLAGFWALSREPQGGQGNAQVRVAMTPFRTHNVGFDLTRFLSRIDPSGPSPEESKELMSVARQAARVAEQVAEIDPGRDRPAWWSFSAELRLAAADMAEASRIGDVPGLLSATRRANESCVRCHLAFR